MTFAPSHLARRGNGEEGQGNGRSMAKQHPAGAHPHNGAVT